MTAIEIDVKALKNIQQRFAGLSQQRLERMLDSYNLAQQDAIKLLPLLFHVNHPGLPGYVDADTLCGIANYQPSKEDLKIGKSFGRSFKYEKRAFTDFPLIGLYLMGSTGTLAQTIRSDLDLWVCLQQRPSPSEAKRLKQKVALIQAWLESKGIELNGYLVFEQQFKQSHDNQRGQFRSGDTQNFLLLDEFYRTAVWLCGRMPLWWVVPPDTDYREYASRLLEQGFLDSSEWLDLGDIANIPPAEYFSAALWQLYKATSSPYKSSLKLLVLEIYARFFPQSGLISDRYKQLVYAGETELEKLDPYLLILDFAENFLKYQPKRLEFLRRAFYLKSGIKIQLDQAQVKNWRYQQILRLVKRWRWRQTRLDYLNRRSEWKIDSVIEERVDLVRELTHSYHFIMNFARVQGVLDEVGQHEFIALGRMLYAAFEKRDGKVDLVNCGIAKTVTETDLTLVQAAESWNLYLGHLKASHLAHKNPVYSASNCFELLAWACCNRVADRGTRFHMLAEQADFKPNFAAEISQDLEELITLAGQERKENAFERTAIIRQVGIYLNTEQDPLVLEKQQGIYSLNNLQDGFCWGENQLNLLQQFDVLWCNSWGEFETRRYQGEDCWIKFLRDFRDTLTTSEDAIQLFSRHLPPSVNPRAQVFALLRQFNRLFNESRRKHQCYRYLMSQGSGYLRVDFDRQNMRAKFFPTMRGLMLGLGDSLSGPIKLRLDPNLNLPAPILRILKKPPADHPRCYFLQVDKSRYNVLILDADNHLYFRSHRASELVHLVNHYQQFIDSFIPLTGASDPGLLQLACFHGYLNPGENPKQQKFRQIKPSSITLSENYLSVRAIAQRSRENRLSFDFYVEGEAFLERELGEQTLPKLVRYITDRRGDHEDYPVFITDMELSSVISRVRLIDCLVYKRIVEQRLARAMKSLSG